MKRVLFPTDFSECAEQAYAHGTLLCGRTGAELHVLNVTPENIEPANDPMAHLSLESDDESIAANGTTDDAPVIVVHSRMRAPSVTRGILDYANTHDVDLIVMGTHGRHGIDHLMMGSVAEDVVRNAACAVLTVRYDESNPAPAVVNRILVPIDFSEFSSLPVAVEMARSYGAELDLLHVIEESVLPTIYGVEPLSPGAPLYIQRTEGALQKLLEETGVTDIVARKHVRIGHAPRRILEFADECRVDLIVLGSHGRTGLSRLLIGSVADKVVRLAPCPVFTVKSFGKSLVGKDDVALKKHPISEVASRPGAANGMAGAGPRPIIGT